MSALDNLSRLAAKPGIQSTLVLSRNDGSIIKATGSLATDLRDHDSSKLTEESDEPHRNAGGTKENSDLPSGEGPKKDPTGAEILAKAVFTFIGGAEELGACVDHEDDIKLLRMRTRNHEIVVVPGETLS